MPSHFPLLVRGPHLRNLPHDASRDASLQAALQHPIQLQPGQVGHLAAEHLLHRHAREEAGHQWEHLPGKSQVWARAGGRRCGAALPSQSPSQG